MAVPFLFLYSSSLSQQCIPGVSDLMAMIIIMILITQNALVGSADPMAVFVIVDSAEEPLSASSDLVTMLIVMVCVCSKQAGAAVSDLVAVLVIMIRAIRQDARAAKDLLHEFRLLLK